MPPRAMIGLTHSPHSVVLLATIRTDRCFATIDMALNRHRPISWSVSDADVIHPEEEACTRNSRARTRS